MNPYRDKLLSSLQAQASDKRAEWWNGYMKDIIPFMGVEIPVIRKLLIDFEAEEHWSALPMNRQVSLVYGMMRGEYAEEKLAAILFMQLFWLGRERPTFLLRLISDWFDERYIYDWNTTDWLSVRILGPLVDSGDPVVLAHLARWNRDPYLWKARASLVPFAQARTLIAHLRSIDRFSDTLIRREERFAKTAVGWVMRECSRDNSDFVLDFLSRHVKYITAEVKRNALKYYRDKPKS